MILFLSDLHLGNKNSKTDKILKFLSRRNDETIFLLGDVIDNHTSKRWSLATSDVISRLMQFPNITYIPGNHDYFMRKILGKHGHIRIVDETVVCLGSKTYLLTHGDKYDKLVQWTHYFSESFFSRLIRDYVDPFYALTNSHLERSIARSAKQQGLDGVICGHTHNPKMKVIEGVEYINYGDWVRSFTAVEWTKDQGFKLLKV